MMVHRVREPERPRDLGEFVAWVEHMNADMLAAGVELGDRYDFDVVHGHDWLVAVAGDHLAKRFRCPLVVTIHATEYGRHQGWVDKHPQSHIHGVERWMANRAERVITCSAYMREHVCRHLRARRGPRGGDPQRHRPVGPACRSTTSRRCARSFAAPRREARAAGRPPRLREGLPARARGAARADRAGRQRALHRRRLGHRTSRSCASRPRARPRRARHLPRLDRRRRAALALPDRRPLRGALDLRAVRARGAGGDGLRLPVHRGRHRRPARGRARRRGRRPALPRARPRARWRRWSSACSPTRRCATGSSPRPASTCSASTGPTSPDRSRRSTASSGSPSRRACAMRSGPPRSASPSTVAGRSAWGRCRRAGSKRRRTPASGPVGSCWPSARSGGADRPAT